MKGNSTLEPQESEKFNSQSRFLTLGDSRLVEMKGAASVFAREVETKQRPRWLSLLGASGSGKTFLARELFKFAAPRCPHSGVRLGVTSSAPSTDFATIDEIEENAKPPQPHTRDYLRSLANEWFLVIDDLGDDHDPSGYMVNVISRLLDRRLGKWTVITSNLSHSQISQDLDARIASRMIRGGSQILEITVPDFWERDIHSQQS